MEKKVHSPFGLGSAQSAARSNLCSPHAASARAEYRWLRGVGTSRPKRGETTAGIGDALHHRGLALVTGSGPPLPMANLQGPGMPGPTASYVHRERYEE